MKKIRLRPRREKIALPSPVKKRRPPPTEEERAVLKDQYTKAENARSENYNLTRKQILFAEKYIATNDATHALVEAGYAPVRTKDGNLDKTRTGRRAHQYLSNPKLRAYIEILREDVVEKVSWDAQKVLDKMYQTYMRATEGEDYTNANRALESMGKHLGMFIDKKEIKQNTHFHGADSAFTQDIDADIKNLAAVSGYEMDLKIIKGGKDSE